MGFLETLKKFFSRKKIQADLLTSETQEEKKEEVKDNESLSFESKENIIDQNFFYGYVLKTLKSIEESLKRIEYNMITKDWASLNLSEKKDLEDLLEKLEDKIENIKTASLSRNLYALTALSRTSRLEDIIVKAVEIISTRKEISYDDLAKELGISSSYLRAIVGLIELKDSRIRRVIKNRKGYFVFEEEKKEASNFSSQ